MLKMLESIERHLGIRSEPVGNMTQPTQPHEVVKQIEELIENENA